MFLIWLLIVVTAALSGTAAYFSVYGLAQTFAVIFVPVIIMGIALEAAKLTAVSALFHYWKDLHFTLKSYLIVAILSLMAVTSWGIFGFLSAAHQTDTIDLKTDNARSAYITQEKANYEGRLKNIDEQIKAIGDQRVTSKIRLIRALNSEKKGILAHLDQLNTEQDKLLSKKLTVEAKVGPIVFIAKALHTDVDNATIYLILLLMAAFDPLAVALTLTINVAFKLRRNRPREQSVPASQAEQIDPAADETISVQPLLSRLDQVLDYNKKKTDILKTVRDIDN